MTRIHGQSEQGNVGSSFNPWAGRLRRARAAAPFKRRLLVETLEQRVLMDADPLAVVTVAGSIDSAGEVDHYTFHLDASTRVSFDSLTQNGNLNWSLIGPSGKVIDRATFISLSGTTAGYAPMELMAGDYKLDVAGDMATTGAYSLRVLDLTRATTVTLDTAVTGTFEQSSQTVAYVFDASAGDQLFLTWQQRPDAYLRVYDPFGQQVNANWGTGQYMDSAVPVLPFSGRYTVLLDGSSGVPAGAGFGFTLHKTTAPVQNLGVWSGPALAIDASVPAAGDRSVVTFTLGSARSVLLDSLTPNDNLQVSLTGPNGQVMDSYGQAISDRGLLNYLDHGYYGTGAMALPAGQYTLVVSGSGNAHGTASLRLVDLGAATVIARGSVVSADLAPGNTLKAFSFDAAAGDKIDIDVISSSGGGATYQLIDPYGRKMSYSFSLSDQTNLTLPATGRYTLAVSGDNARTATTSFSFRLIDRGNSPPAPLPAGAPLAVGETVEGSIAANGSTVWNFTLDHATTVYVDPLTQNPGYYTATWSLQGPRGSEVENATYGGYQYYGWDDGAKLLTLPAGAYALTVRSSSAMPSVKLRVVDIGAAAAPAPANTPITGRLDPGSAMAAYRFNASAGQHLFFAALDGTNQSYLRYRLLDPAGREAIASRGWGDWNGTLTQQGEYTLLVEGSNSAGVSPLDYRFMLSMPTDTQTAYDPALNIGTGPAWTSDGTRAAVRVDSRNEIRVDPAPALNLAHDASFQVRVRVDNFDQTWQSIVFKGGDGSGSGQHTYTLWVNSSGALQLSTTDAAGQMVVNSVAGTVKAGQWYDITGVLNRTGGEMRLYVDGVLATSGVMRTQYGDAKVWDTPLTLGSTRENAGYSSNYQLSGAIGEFRLWDRALGAAEVNNLITAVPSSADSHLKLWLKLDENSGSVLADASQSGLAASIHSRFAGMTGVVAGHLDLPGEQDVYRLSLAETTSFYLDGLTPYTITNGGNFTLAINGPRTSFSENLLYFSNRVLTLPAGDYTFTVSGSGRSVGDYAFRLVDQSHSIPMTLGQKVSGTLDPGDGAALYRFDAAAGDALYFQSLGSSGFTPAWRLIDPFGREVFGRSTMSDRDPTPLALGGTYTLIVDGDYSNYGQVAQYAFKIAKVSEPAIMPINIAAGSDAGIQRSAGRNGGGAVQVSDAQYIEFADSPATDSTGSFTLQTSFRVDSWPPGSNWIPLVSKATPESQRQYGVFITSDGRIQITSNASNGSSNSVQSAAGLVTAGTWNDLAAVYDRANSQLRIVLNGVQVAQGSLSSLPAVDLAEPMRIGYTPEGSEYHGHQLTVDQLAIWNRALTTPEAAAASSTPLTGSEAGLAALYRFDEAAGAAVVDARGAGSGAIRRIAAQVNGLVTGRLDQAGQVRRYSFTLAEPAQMYFDSLTRRSDIRWTLQGEGLSTSDTFYNDAINSRNLLSMPAGSYTITVDGTGPATGDFMFRLIDASSAAHISLDQEVSGRLDPGSISTIYHFDAAAGQRVYFDVLANTSPQPVWRLLDPSGAQVFGVNWFGDRDATTLARTGTYTLIVEDYGASGARDQVRDFKFVIRDVHDRTIDLAVGSEQLLAPAWRTGPLAGGQAVQLGSLQQVVIDPSAAHDLTGNVTIELMVRLDGPAPGWIPLVSRTGDDSHQTFGVWVNSSGQLQLETNNNGQKWTLASAANTLVAGDWHRVSVAINRSGGSAAIYLDGQQVATRTLSVAQQTAAASIPTASLRIGGTDLPAWPLPLNGAVADLRLWNTALSAAVIDAQRNLRLSGNEAGLVLNLKMDEGSGRALADSGPNNLDGRIANINAGLTGTVVEGAISAPGQRIFYRLTPADDSHYLFDSLTTDSNFTWTLRDQGGNVVTDAHGTSLNGRSLRNSDYSSRYDFVLRGGREYTLEVDGSADATGRFAFRLADLRDSTLITYGATVSATVPQANSATLYAFDAVAGDQVLLDYLANTGDLPRWRLYSPTGFELHNAYFYEPGQPGTLTLGESGRYTVVIDNPIDAHGLEQHQFKVQLTGHITLAPPPGSTALAFSGGAADVTGTLAAINEPKLYSFTLTEPMRLNVDALPSASSPYVEWKLTGPNGLIADHFSYDTDGPNGRSYYDLAAGSYSFAVSTNTSGSLGNFAFRLLDITASAAPLSLGVPVSGTLTPANTTRFYSFSGDQGDRLYFGSSAATNMSSAFWRVLDAQTLAVVGENYYTSGLESVKLPRSGNYLLALEGYYGSAGASSYTFTAYRNSDPVHALTLGARTEAVLAQPGDTQRYNFTLSQASKLWFDSLAPRSDITWRVLDSEGVEVITESDGLDYGWETTARFDLSAGSYTLIIDGSGAATGNYAFRLLDLAAATAITPGIAVSGQLAPSDSTSAFQFSALAGDRFVFDVLSRSSGNTYWRLLDPYGHNVFYGGGMVDQATTAMPFSGTYTIVVEGYPHDATSYSSVNFSFNVQPVLEQAPIPLAIGTPPGPNLLVQGLAAAGADGSVHSGGSLVVSWNSANNGVRDVTTAFQERIVVRNAAGETLVNQLVGYDPVAAGAIRSGAGVARGATVQLPAGARGAGTLTVSVITDVANAVQEQGSGENDNSAQITLQSALMTYPDLTVSGVVLAPNSNLAAGDAATISWRVGNGGELSTSAGWSDRVVVRNLSTGEIVLDQTSRIEGGGAVIAAGAGVDRQLAFNWPAGRNGAGQFQVTVTTDALGEVAEYNAADTAEANNTASIVVTSAPDLSIEGLQVLTADPVSGGEVQLAWTVRNGGNAPTPAGWYDRITAVNLDTGLPLLNLDVSYAPVTALAAGASAARTFTLRLPDGAASVGRIRFTVTTDQNTAGAGTLPETNEANNSASAEGTAVLRRAPNLVASEFSAPASQRSGDLAAFAWTVNNTGNAATGATSWYDRIVMSQDAVIGNADDVTIASVLHTGALESGAGYSVSMTQLVPGGYDGSYRFALVTDVLGQVAEPDAEGDNVSAVKATLLTAYHADLVPTLLSVPAAANGGATVPVTWRVTNQGDATTNSSWWVDRLWLSLDGTVGAGSGAIDLGTFGHSGALAVGASYDMTQNVVMPNGVTGNYKLVLQTNHYGYVFESRFGANNTVASDGAIALTVAPAVDLRVENVSGPATAQPGQLQTVSWEIANNGAGTAAGPWTDQVWLSRDGTLAGAVYLTSLTHDAPLAGGARQQSNVQFWMPDVGDGAWQVLVLTDVNGQVYETGAADAESGNRGVAAATAVVHPDVRANDVAVGAGATAGRASTVTWTTRNDGSAPVLPGWFEKLFLSADATLDGGDLQLGSFAVDAALGAGATLARSASVMLPDTLAAGSWRIIVVSDSGNALRELAGEANNVAASAAVTVAEAPLPNLAPANVAGPAAMRPGATVTVNWDERNLLAEPASGTWATQVFLSNDAVLGADLLVGSVSWTGTVAGNGSVARSAQVSLPTTLAPGNWRFVVKTDSGNGVNERNELDNSAIAAADSVVAAALQLNLRAGSVAEAAGATTATVQRNGDLAQALTIAIASSDAGEATVPATVTIPAGQASITFGIVLPADGIVDGTQLVQIAVSAAGVEGDSRTLSVTDSDVPALELSSVVAVQENQGSVHMTVHRNTGTGAGDQLIRLSSTNAGALNVPGTVVIPAGADSVSFDATLVDDPEVWGTRDIRVNAVADGYRGDSVNIAVVDDELPELTMTFSASQVAEGAGANSVGVTLRRNRPGTYDLVVNIASAMNESLTVPTRVVIGAGETEVHFNASPVDNGDVNPNREVAVRATILAPNGMQIGQNAAVSTLLVTDDDGPTLSVSLESESVGELGSPILGVVRRNTGTVGDLVVALSSSNAGEATVPATVTIPAGQATATFQITPVADNVADGTKAVTIRARAAGFNDGAAGLTVTEGDLPDLVVSAIGFPAGGVASTRIDISWSVSNAGRADAAGGFRDRVYLSRDTVLSSADRLVAAVIHPSTLLRDGTYTQSASIQLPEETGEYHIIVLTDALGSLAEGSERNNVSAAAATLMVRAPLTATVQTAVTRLAVSGEANATVVPLTGTAVDAITGAPAARQAVRVMVRTGAVERLLDATTDANGTFTVDFKPLPGEAGHFEIGAGYVGDHTFAVQDSFDLIGLAASVPLIHMMGTNEVPLEGHFTLKNLGDVALSGLTAAVQGLAENFQFEILDLAGALDGSGTTTVNWRLTGHGITDALATSRGTLTFTTSEGATERVLLDLACIPQSPKLVTSPGYLAQGMLRGVQTMVSFDVFNQGAADTGPVQVVLPDLPWMTLTSLPVIDNIAAGGKATVTLALRPDASTELIRFDGVIALNAKLAGVAVPFQFRAVSAARGDLHVSVSDQLTFFAEGAPKVAGATVTLTDPFTFDVVATTTTDADGNVMLADLAEGQYLLTVTADKHASFRGTIHIKPGTTTDQDVILDRQLVSYSWNVVPTDVQDHYKIVLESTFETEVPLPVVTVDPLLIPVVLPGVTSTTMMTLTNHGLVQAENVAIKVPVNDDLFEIVALTPMIDVLPAMSSVQVPITIRLRDGVTAAQVAAAMLPDPTVGAEGALSSFAKCLGIDTQYTLPCALLPPINLPTRITVMMCGADLGQIAQNHIKDHINGEFDLRKLGCDALDVLLQCFDASPCTKFIINAACNAAVGAVTGGPAGAAAGAASALGDMIDCLCPYLGKLASNPSGGTTTPGANYGGGSWGAFAPYGSFSFPNFGIRIDLKDCKEAGATSTELERASEGLLDAVASGALPPDSVAVVAQHDAVRAEQLAQAQADGDGVLNADAAGICAQVRIRIEQEAVLTRTAFQGTLEVTNGNPDVPLTGVQLVLDIRDENGNAVNDLFAARAPALSGLTAIDGTGVIAGGANGRAQYLFIPTVDAARDAPARYTIGGTLSYIEGGKKITVPLMPAKITVYPEARLKLDYFQQRDVIGDDPFTEDVVEPSEQFALGLLVSNDGKGDARNLSIASAQPKIIENEKGLLIDFKIVGTQVGADTVAPTLTANLGNIAAGQSQVAQWLMTSSLQGKFVDYTASFEHTDGMGDTRLSLIESVNIHELIRSVRANGGDAPDFLANDDPDADHTPDRLYLNDGSQHVVRAIGNAAAAGSATLVSLAVAINADSRAGWGYLKIADPGVGYVLDRIVRSDGKVLNLGREVWRTSRSFPESIPGAVRENLLHFIDQDSTGHYTAYFKIDDSVAPRLVEIVAVAPDPASAPVDTIDVRFSEQLDPASFTVADLTLAREGQPGVNLLDGATGVTVTALGEGAYRIGGLAALTASGDLYRLTVNAAGVADYAGNAGTGVLTETWGVGEIGPYVLSMAAGPVARNTPLDTVDITFSTALDASSFSADDLRLERDGVLQSLAGVDLSLTRLAGNQYRVGGLAPLTGAAGGYTLTLTGAGLLSSGGAAGLGSQAVGWKMDTVAPQVIDLIDLIDQIRKTVVLGLDVELSEQVDLASFDYRDVVLTRTVGGVTSPNLIDARTRVEYVSGTTYRISGFNWVSGVEGSYRLSVNGEGLADLAGNTGAGSASTGWLMDFHDPAAATNLAVNPDSGSNDADGVINTLRFTLTGSVGEAGLAVRVSDRTTGNEIGYATVAGNNFSIPVVLDGAGRHELRVRSVDPAGNLADSVVVVFVDQVRPTMSAPVLARDTDGNVGSITLDFSEALDPATVTLDAFALTRDGGSNVLGAATLTRGSATRYVLSGLAPLTAPAGSYQLSVDLTRLRDLAGNAGATVAQSGFAGALASTGTVSGTVFDDIDGTGTREADEMAQGGWTVFDDVDADGQLGAGETSSITDSAGRYSLEGLALGQHRITVLVPSGWTITPAPVAQVTLGAEAPAVTRNFGAFGLAGLSGVVFDDANANGVRDAGEAGLAGRQVLLDLNGNGAADAGEAVTTSDADGRYALAGLRPGSGRVVLFAGDGWLPLQNPGMYAPKSGEAATRDLAAVRPGIITGMKYEDANGNGAFDAGEAGVAGWRVFLDDNGNDALDVGERYTYTDVNGIYAFTALRPGSYRVVEEVRTGWIQTAPGAIEAGNGSQQGLDVQLSLPGMIADMEEQQLIDYLNGTGANFNCGCGTFVLEKYTTGQAAGHFTKLDTITDPMLASLTGKGVRVAVIDTGINTSSSFFGPDANGDGVADRIAFQYDFGDGDGDASDMLGHGTNVAGVIAGSDAQYGGVATEADLVVLKVFDANNQGYMSTLKRALEWLDANAEAYGIGVVNMSLGDGGNWGEAISRYGMADLFQRLAAKGLVMVAASGNNYFQTGGALGVAYPGADPAVLSVGAMWAGNFGGPWRFSSGATDYTTAYGRIASFTQRDPDQIDVMAPGARFTSAGLNGGLSTMQGTSQAAAFMSGAATLVQQAAKSLMGRYLNTGEFAALLDLYTYRAVDGDDESDNVANSSASYNKLDIPKLLQGLKNYAASGGGAGGGSGGGGGSDAPLTAYSARTATVGAGQTLANQDFGNFKLGQVAGQVYGDASRDGVQQDGEDGLAGVTVFIDADDDGVLDDGEARASTDAAGHFAFGALGPGAITLRTIAPDGQQVTGAAVQRLTVTSGLDVATLRFGYASAAPEVSAADDAATLNEDASVTVDVLANDQGGAAAGLVLAVEGDGPAHGSVQVVDGRFVYTPLANYHGDDSFRYTVTAPGGASSSATVSITVTPVNDAPSLAPVASQVVAEGDTLVLQLAGSDPDSGDSLRYSLLAAPQGATIDPATGELRWTATALASLAQVRVRVSDGSDAVAEQSFSIEVRLGKLVATSFATQPWGFAIRFNDVIDQSQFNLYGANPDLEVRGARVGAVAGSVLFDADGKGLQFVRTGATLEADQYTVRLKSGAAAVTSASRGNLDGDGDGSAGGDFVASFAAVAPPPVRLRLPDFARAAGQAVQVPNTATGIPVTMVNSVAASSMTFRLMVDPALMTVASINAGSGLPPGATVNVQAIAGGFLVQIQSGVPIAAGSRQILNVAATMNGQAQAGSAGMLRLEGVTVNGAAAPDAGDAGVVYVGNTGDIDRNSAYDSVDVNKLQRLVVKLDTFVAGADDIDPLVIGDVDADGALTSRDVSAVLARTKAASTTLIPAVVAPAPIEAASSFVAAPAPLASQASPVAGTGGATTLNLAGSPANFTVKAAPAPAAGTVSAQVALKVVPSVKSMGVAA